MDACLIYHYYLWLMTTAIVVPVPPWWYQIHTSSQNMLVLHSTLYLCIDNLNDACSWSVQPQHLSNTDVIVCFGSRNRNLVLIYIFDSCHILHLICYHLNSYPNSGVHSKCQCFDNAAYSLSNIVHLSTVYLSAAECWNNPF